MRQHFIPAIIAAFVGAAASYGVAVNYKPKPVIVQPQTNVVTRSMAPTKSELRLAAASWGNLDQKEIDAITAAVREIPKAPLTIFCQDDAKCGDMQLDFDNAFESAHWETKLETPLIDDTVGVGTSLPALRDAINAATGDRLGVKLIKKNAAFEVLVIGKKPR